MVPTQNRKKNQGGLKENLTQQVPHLAARLMAPHLAAKLTALPFGADFSDLDSSEFSDLSTVFPFSFRQQVFARK